MKKKMKNLVSSVILSLIFTSVLRAQGPIDGFFAKKGNASISLSYASGNYDEFYVGSEKVGPVPSHNKIHQTIYSVYATYSLADNLTAVANLPYIKAEGKGVADPINGSTEQSDFQDVSAFIKWAPHITRHKNSSMTYIVAVGGTIPLGYEPSGILSLGNGAPGLDSKVGLQYKNNSGFFGFVTTGYGLRSKADNNLGIGDGEKFDAPDVLNSVIKLGYAGKHFYIDAWLDSQSSVSGVDIMGEGFFGNFPETRVNYSKVGATAYVPISRLIGASIGFGKVINGRNIGLDTYYTGALTINL